MNKLYIALSVAAVAALSGCLDPQYKSRRASKTETTVVAGPKAETEPEVVVAPPEPVKDSDIKVDVQPEPTPPAAEPKVLAPEFTTYIIQRGDSLSKISKRYNITIAAIKGANPQIKNDIVKLGQKIKLPGKVDVGEQSVPAGAFATPAKTAPAKAPASKIKAAPAPSAKGAKTYVVKNGDTLGGIAKANGTTVRQIKELNGMKSDVIVVGKELKIPAANPAKAAPSAGAKISDAKKSEAAPAQEPGNAEVPVVTPVADENIVPAPAGTDPVVVPAPENAEPQVVVPAPQPISYEIYTVQPGDEDIIGIAISHRCNKNEILELNNFADDVVITPGMKIKIPKKPADTP